MSGSAQPSLILLNILFHFYARHEYLRHHFTGHLDNNVWPGAPVGILPSSAYLLTPVTIIHQRKEKPNLYAGDGILWVKIGEFQF